MTLTITRRHVAALALPLALLAVGTTVLAQTAMHPAKMATMICRPAQSGETANAATIGTTTELVCEPFAMSMRMSDGTMMTIGNVTVKANPGPDFSGALTAQQAKAAYNKWVLQTFHIDPAREHTN